MPIPKKITPNPVVEAVVELRFDTNIPSEAVLGVVYPVLQEIINGEFEKLPILQLPEHVRMNDHNLKFAPHFKFKNDSYQVNIGPRVLAIVAVQPYKGWEEYSPLINKILSSFDDLNIIRTISRLGVRYIDFFNDIDINEKLKFKVQGFPYTLNDLTLSSSFKVRTPFTTNLHIATNQTIVTNNSTVSGSIFDTDTYIECNDPYSLNDILERIESAHDVGKEVFFSSMNDDFIASLNPEY
ncbi:MAG: TIGR04255 family protein [Pseudomonadota bacterium]|nr:TIGR04255 family protein [Pseudomonadota bacterium]